MKTENTDSSAHATKISHPLISYSLVLLQFGLLGALLLTGPWFASSIGFTLQALGGLLGVWAIQTMHIGHFNIIPDPKPDSDLVQAGPYKFIRHPMYMAILLVFTPLVIEHISLLRLGIWAGLVTTLLAKLHYEESLLKCRYSDYTDYQTRSHKLIPYIY